MCAMASFSDNFNHPSPTASVQVMNVNWFQKQSSGNDELVVENLRGLAVNFHLEHKAAEYETPGNSLNQISLWDSIIPSKERAKFNIHKKNKYHLIDQGSNFPGKEFNLTLHRHVMPKTGQMFTDQIVMTGYRLPVDYR